MLSLLLLAGAALLARGAVFEGATVGTASWQLVARFAFQPTSDELGELTVSVDFPRRSQLAVHVFYADAYSEWDAVGAPALSCSERRALARNPARGIAYTLAREAWACCDSVPAVCPPAPGVDAGDPARCERCGDAASRAAGQYLLQVRGGDRAGRFPCTVRLPPDVAAGGAEPRWHVSKRRLWRIARPKWFFVALANCEPGCAAAPFCEGPLAASFKVSLRSPAAQYPHLSAEEAAMPALTQTFLALQTLLGAWVVKLSLRLGRLRKLHATVRLLRAAAALQWLALALALRRWAEYGRTGDAASGARWRTAAAVAEALGDATLVLLLLLLAKGWTVVRRKISAQGRTKLAAFGAAYV